MNKSSMIRDTVGGLLSRRMILQKKRKRNKTNNEQLQEKRDKVETKLLWSSAVVHACDYSKWDIIRLFSFESIKR